MMFLSCWLSGSRIGVRFIKINLPGKRGPRAKKEKLSAELEGIRAELAESAKGE